MSDRLPLLFKMLSLLSLCLCGQCIAYSSQPLIFAGIAAATVGIFMFYRGSESAVFILIAVGPIVNMTRLYCDPYIYSIEIVILTYLACLFWKNAGKSSPEKLDGLSVSYIILIATVLIATGIHCAVYGKNIPEELRLVRLFLVGGLLLTFLKSTNKKNLPVYYKTALLSTLAISIAGILEFAIRSALMHNWGQEPCSVFNGSEILALYLCTLIPFILIGISSIKNGPWANIAVVTVVAAMLVLLATRSRTGIMAVIIFLPFYALRFVQTKSRLKIPMILLIVAIAIIAVLTTGTKTFHSEIPAVNNVLALIFSSRLDDWRGGLTLFAQAPLWGSGSGKNVYNILLQVSSQFGVLGLGAFAVFTVFVFVNYFRNRAKVASSLQTGMFWSVVTLLIAGIGESALGNQFGYYILFLFLLVGTSVSEATSSLG